MGGKGKNVEWKLMDLFVENLLKSWLTGKDRQYGSQFYTVDLVKSLGTLWLRGLFKN